MTLMDCIDPEKIIPISRLSTKVFKTGTWGARAPAHQERLSPCRQACPAGEDIPAYMALARAGKLEEAFMRLTRENPLPAVCGRVCYHPCEAGCLQQDLGGAVSIHRVERCIGDYGLGSLSLPAPALPASGASVAVVGSGPAGLSCAYHARRLGHQVTLFEAENVLGGLLRFGIPAYRLPRDVLAGSIKMILDTGIEVETGFRLGEKGSWDRLNQFEAVFLAIGAHDPVLPRIEGTEQPGVMTGLGFLKEVNLGRLDTIEGPVAVMGGGNTAIDAARVSLRLGAQTTILYRRSREEMPASPDEISDALREGAGLVECSLPVAIRRSEGGGLRVACAKTEAQGRDETGRMRYVPIKGSEFEVAVKTLILGIGQNVVVPEEGGPVGIASGGVQTGPFLDAGPEKFYAGGDMTSEPRRVCDAIGSGKLAALGMHAKLNGLDMDTLWDRVRIGRGPAFSMSEYLEGGEGRNPRISVPVSQEEVKPEWCEASQRIEPEKLSPDEAVKGFGEVAGDVKEAELAGACSRCFSCGTCTSCDRCYLYCPEVSVTPPGEGTDHYEADSEYCKGCGVCASVCPRGVMTMMEGK